MQNISLFSLKNPELKPLKIIEKTQGIKQVKDKKPTKVKYLDYLYSKTFIEEYFS